MKAVQRRSSVSRELEILEQKQQEIGDGLQKAVVEGLTRVEGVARPASSRVEDDFALLMDE
jgi:hypothetical protein